MSIQVLNLRRLNSGGNGMFILVSGVTMVSRS